MKSGSIWIDKLCSGWLEYGTWDDRWYEIRWGCRRPGKWGDFSRGLAFIVFKDEQLMVWDTRFNIWKKYYPR